MSAPVRVAVEGPVATLELDQPPLNPLDARVRAGLLTALEACRARRVRAIVLTARGRVFCAGADRDDARAAAEQTDGHAPTDAELFSELAAYPGAVVAAVNGKASGAGLELALACDLRVAARSASFAGLAVAHGLVASTARLTRLCGEAVAKDLLLTARTISAEEALALGLVSTVVDDDALAAEARAQAETIASRAPLSVQANKVALGHCARLPLAEAVTYERGEWARLQQTHDHKEALAAFFAKRPPEFTGT